MSWKDDDEVTTTYGTIQQAKEENYIRGFYDGMEQGKKNGLREEREYILSFIDDHEGIPINLQDIKNEIEHRYKKEQEQSLKESGLWQQH